MKKTDTPIDCWTEEDFLNGRCDVMQVNKPKPLEVETAQEVFASLPPATLSEFKQAVLRVARDQYGSYDAFLKAHPGFHQKFLLSMAREPVPSTPPDNTIKDIPWLTRNRLAYKDPQLMAALQLEDLRSKDQVQDATFIERSPKP